MCFRTCRTRRSASLHLLPKHPPARYGFAAGIATLFGGGGGVIRQSINFQTASMSNAVRIAPTTCRMRLSRKRLLRKRVDPLRQRKIEISQATLTVGRKHQSHLVKTNVDIW